MKKSDLLGCMITEFPINTAVGLSVLIISISKFLIGLKDRDENFFIGIIFLIFIFLLCKISIKYMNWYSEVFTKTFSIINNKDLNIKEVESNLAELQKEKTKLLTEYNKENIVLRAFVRNIYNRNLTMLNFSIDILNLRINLYY